MFKNFVRTFSFGLNVESLFSEEEEEEEEEEKEVAIPIEDDELDKDFFFRCSSHVPRLCLTWANDDYLKMTGWDVYKNKYFCKHRIRSL